MKMYHLQFLKLYELTGYMFYTSNNMTEFSNQTPSNFIFFFVCSHGAFFYYISSRMALLRWFCVTAREKKENCINYSFSVLPFLSDEISFSCPYTYKKKEIPTRSLLILFFTTMVDVSFKSTNNIHIANINYLNTLVKRVRQFDYWIFFLVIIDYLHIY